jgi:hypothetical protein
MAIWQIFPLFGKFFPVLVFCTQKYLATLEERCFLLMSQQMKERERESFFLEKIAAN